MSEVNLKESSSNQAAPLPSLATLVASAPDCWIALPDEPEHVLARGVVKVNPHIGFRGHLTYSRRRSFVQLQSRLAMRIRSASGKVDRLLAEASLDFALASAWLRSDRGSVIAQANNQLLPNTTDYRFIMGELFTNFCGLLNHESLWEALDTSNVHVCLIRLDIWDEQNVGNAA